VLAEQRLLRSENAELGVLLPLILEPPVTEIGALPVDAFLSPAARASLAADLNTLLAAPSFVSWRQGQSVDVGSWMTPVDGRTPATIVSVAHLDDDERVLVLGVILEELLSWVRSLPSSNRLKALIIFDEVYGYLPPHPASPPTKKPLVALMKQARAYLGENKKRSALSALVKKLTPRWFVVKGAKTDQLSLLYPRDMMSYLRGPMTQGEIGKAVAAPGK